MSSIIEISDDDESIKVSTSNTDDIYVNNTVILSSDSKQSISDKTVTSDDDSISPSKIHDARSAVMKCLFPESKSKDVLTTSKSVESNNKSVFLQTVAGVKISMPVKPYRSQIAIINKVIVAIQKSMNCLLESPTGSGKTLALLCSSLAWQAQEKDIISQNAAQQSTLDNPTLQKVDGVVEYMATPTKNTNVSFDNHFSRNKYGEMSIYDSPKQGGSGDATSSRVKRQEPPEYEAFPTDGLVTIHKKRRLNPYDIQNDMSPERPTTAVKKEMPTTPPSIRELVESLRNKVSMVTHCSLPTIYYGARTHKQLQQVIKEFKRTAYCGDSLMTVLSSREHSCIREMDRKLWTSKNEMCRSCVKEKNPNREKYCKYFQNHTALNHDTLPPAFDLEDLVKNGNEKCACPYYAARKMMMKANIIFCPYNYLIEPAIRNSLKLNLEKSIVIIDEAHNIEDICRDVATFTFSRATMQCAIMELEKAAQQRFANDNSMSNLEYLLGTLKIWDSWFKNQMPLLDNQPVNNDETVFLWQPKDFVQTLDNHNIGQQHYTNFNSHATTFCQCFRDDPDKLTGVSEVTGILIESLNTALGYLFRSSGTHIDDFKPALKRSTDVKSWRKSQLNQSEDVSLRLICMNPAIVFESLKSARCIILASGTLSPMTSLHSELDTKFPLQVSPAHIIPQDRVWIGSLKTGPDGDLLKCTNEYNKQVYIQDALGETILRVCRVTPNGVLCFLPSYMLMNILVDRWQGTNLWRKLKDQKNVFMESRDSRDHNEVMEDFYDCVKTVKGALLFAVYRGKVAEGMDFKDHQARAVITIGIPYPSVYDIAVKGKKEYNDKYASTRNLLPGGEWLRVQAYRALNQAVGRCVRHRGDWGAVLLVDARFGSAYYQEHLAGWVRAMLGNNHHTFESLVNGNNSLETFMQTMTLRDDEESM